jgi:hypothetical protein
MSTCSPKKADALKGLQQAAGRCPMMAASGKEAPVSVKGPPLRSGSSNMSDVPPATTGQVQCSKVAREQSAAVILA